MKINSLCNFNIYNRQNITKQNNKEEGKKEYNLLPAAYSPNYYLSFEGRVDKGLKRFYDCNKEVMPSTVKNYIETLSENEKETTQPIDAQKNAFEYLEICETPEDIKSLYPDEELFTDIKSMNETKAKRGLLYEIKLMEDDIKSDGEYIVKGEKDLTVYLLKKIFLESKTIGEINEDLDNDLNPVFKKDEKNYITSSTLNALGIKLPRIEYINSLRYTRKGYSDLVGEKLSQNWENLTEQEKKDRIDSLQKARGKMSSEKKSELREKQSQLMKNRWQNMSAEEKVEYINKLQSGSITHKITMINAWNKCESTRKDLSEFLIKNHYSQPSNIIYTEENYSQRMSEFMKNFWAQYPQHADKLGEAISQSHIEVEEAIANNKFDEFMDKTIKLRDEIKKGLKDQKKQDIITQNEEIIVESESQPEISLQELKETIIEQEKELLDKNFTFNDFIVLSIISNIDDSKLENLPSLVEMNKNTNQYEIDIKKLIKFVEVLLNTGDVNDDLAISAQILKEAVLQTLEEAQDAHSDKSYKELMESKPMEVLDICEKALKGKISIPYRYNEEKHILRLRKGITVKDFYRNYDNQKNSYDFIQYLLQTKKVQIYKYVKK